MYGNIAAFYNENIGKISYEAMADFLHESYMKYTDFDEENPIVLDAGCGTGACTILMAKRGYDMIGLDISPEMLQVATATEGSYDVRWICQDMCKMDLFGTVKMVYSITDTINHITEEDELRRFFERTSLFTENGGLIIFDFLREEYFKNVIDGEVFCQEDENGFCVWSGEYENGLCSYDITCFCEDDDGRYTRADEEIVERCWSEILLREIMEETGYELLEVSGDEQRIRYVGKKLSGKAAESTHKISG